jgi:hypothetical protein
LGPRKIAEPLEIGIWNSNTTKLKETKEKEKRKKNADTCSSIRTKTTCNCCVLQGIPPHS